MSEFIEMLSDLPPEAKRRVMLGWVPILLVTLLLCVFGGLPPTSWGLTLRFLSLGNALKDVQASTVSDSLNTLLIQSACTLVGWVVVILAIVFEVMAFRAMQTQIRISRLQAKLATTSSKAPAAAQPLLVALPPARNVAPAGMNMVSPGLGMNMPSASAGMNWAPSGVSMNMASAGGTGMDMASAGMDVASAGSAGMNVASSGASMNMASASMDAAAPPTPKNYGVRVNIDDSPESYPSNPFVGMTADAKSQGVKIPSKQKNHDPFAVQEDDLLEQAPEEEDEGPIFVYGNPFEGDLPEVFSYDKDLQKAVEDLLNETASKQTSNDRKGADKGKKDLDDEPNEDTE